jgi:two-component system LytT family response regulator
MGRGRDRGRASGRGRVRVLIVDDEPPARRELRRLLGEHPEIQVAAEAASCREAEAALARERFDLLFLDVQLHPGSGFDLVPAVPPGTPIVFVTAFDRFAIRAFEGSALDYLVKPVESARLAVTLARAVAKNAVRDSSTIVIGSSGKIEEIDVTSITHVTARGDYCTVHTADAAQRLVEVPLREWERRLPAGEFLRIHRATLVSLRFIERLAPARNGWRVHLRGVTVPLTTSRRRAARVRRRLQSSGLDRHHSFRSE